MEYLKARWATTGATSTSTTSLSGRSTSNRLPRSSRRPVTSVNGATGAVTVREVPAVTTSDNGKFLQVVNGAWAAAEIQNANGEEF